MCYQQALFVNINFSHRYFGPITFLTKIKMPKNLLAFKMFAKTYFLKKKKKGVNKS